MKITTFSANGVQGSLQFDLSFREDFTFLIGLNGSGKTSALRLMMALLTPDLPELSRLSFDTATLGFIHQGREREIFARKSAEGLAFGVSGIESSLLLGAAELQLLVQPVVNEAVSPVLQVALADPVCQFLTKIATPMFLGIDRRFVSGVAVRDASETRRRQFLAKRLLAEETDSYRGNVSAGIADVSILVHDCLSEIRSEQEQLDEGFRNQLLASAFAYQPISISDLQSPDAASIIEYQEKRDDIEGALKSLKIPVAEVHELLDHFFLRMNKVAADLQKGVTHISPKPAPRRGHGRSKFAAVSPPEHAPKLPSVNVVEWMINKPQVERITTHLELLSGYNEKRSALREPIERFLHLLNSFLGDTGKTAVVTERGALMIDVPNQPRRSITALSSGERQLVVMLGHLSLNKQLVGSGVFIVDEPELSLHISWQQRFVDAIREANPAVQVVMATHSPAIILERDDHCESLDPEREEVAADA